MHTSDVEESSARALFAVRAFEAALHSRSEWSMRWGAMRVPAERVFTERGVVFSAVFPDACWLERPDEGVLLLCGEEVMGVRRMDHPGDVMFIVEWEMESLSSTLLAMS